MKKFLLLTLVACSGLAIAAGAAQAGRRGGCCNCCGAPAAPVVVAPAAPATAAAPQAYRSYSYEPQNSTGYSNSFLRDWGGHAYENAANKARGRVN